MRKLCILCCCVLLCIAVCFPVYADLVVPSWPSIPTTVIADDSTTEEDEPMTEGWEPTAPTIAPPTAPTSAVEETTTNPSESSSPIVQRLRAVWAAIVAAAVAVAAFFAKIFHKK